MPETTPNGRRKPSVDAGSSDVQDQLDKLREDISSLTSSFTEFRSGQTGAYIDQAKKKGAELAENSQHMLEQAKRDMKTVEREFEGRVRENPLGAVGIAAGVGFLLAILTRR